MRMIWLRSIFASLTLILLTFLQGACALYENQAGINDWHHQYVGYPIISFPHRFAEEGSTVLVATDRNIVAALNPETGYPIWRQFISESEKIVGLRAGDHNVVTVSIDEDYMIRYWDQHGFLEWETRLSRGILSEGATLLDTAFPMSGSSAVVLLFDGSILLAFDARNGNHAWRTSPDTTGSTSYVRVITRGNSTYAVGHNVRSLNFEVLELRTSSGDEVQRQRPKSNIKKAEDLIVLSAGERGAFALWKEYPNIKINRIGDAEVDGASLQALFDSVIPSWKKANGDAEFVTFGLSSHTDFALQVPVPGGVAAAAFRVDPTSGRLVILHDMGERPGEPWYAAATDDSGELFVTRVFRENEDMVNVEVINPGKHTTVSTKAYAHPVSKHGKIAHVYFAVSGTHEVPNAFRTIAMSSDGSITCWKDDDVVWRREQSLAYAQEAEFLDLPERKLWTQEVDELAEDTEKATTISPLVRYIRRVTTHIMQLKDFPRYVANYIEHFVTGDYSAVDPIPTAGQHQRSPTIHRDMFGFRKLIIFVTPRKVLALDAANKGQVVWSRFFDNPHLELQRVFVVRASMVRYPPVVVIVGTERNGVSRMTRILRLNGLTGEDFVETDAKADFLPNILLPIESQKILKLPIEEHDERTHVLAFVDRDAKVHLYPNTASARKAFLELAGSFYFTLASDTSLSGYQVSVDDRATNAFSTINVWNMSFPGENIVAIGHRPQHEKVASLGRVLGDRSVLYKYLNPHLMTVATMPAGSTTNVTRLNVHLVDTVKGAVVYHTTHDHVSPSLPVHVVQIDNTIVYHYWNEGERADKKGYVVVVFDLYESAQQDERFDSPVFSSFTHERPYVNAQAFVFPTGISALGVTTTRNGIATREFLFALNTNQILGVSRRLLDPRRPQQPLTSEDKEEMLVPYDPVIPEHRRLVLSYNLTLAGIRQIQTSPALLESTSLVLAHGLDVWFAREAPSKQFDVLSEDFSKETLVITIIGLAIGIMITKPMVRRKNVNARWY